MTSKKILVVDDEKNIRTLFSKCLVDAGYFVTTVPDGSSALEVLAKDTYSLIILDMKLPDIDGLEVLRKMKEMVPAPKVIMVTAHGTIQTAVEAMKLGAVDYLQKPVTPEEFRRAVSRNLAPVASLEVTAGDTFTECIAEGRALLEENKLAEALPVIHKAIQLDANRPEAFNLLGALDELRGDQEAARRMYRVALTIDATYKPASFNLNRICQWKPSGGINFGDAVGEELKLRDFII